MMNDQWTVRKLRAAPTDRDLRLDFAAKLEKEKKPSLAFIHRIIANTVSWSFGGCGHKHPLIALREIKCNTIATLQIMDSPKLVPANLASAIIDVPTNKFWHEFAVWGINDVIEIVGDGASQYRIDTSCETLYRRAAQIKRKWLDGLTSQQVLSSFNQQLQLISDPIVDHARSLYRPMPHDWDYREDGLTWHSDEYRKAERQSRYYQLLLATMSDSFDQNSMGDIIKLLRSMHHRGEQFAKRLCHIEFQFVDLFVNHANWDQVASGVDTPY